MSIFPNEREHEFKTCSSLQKRCQNKVIFVESPADVKLSIMKNNAANKNTKLLRHRMTIDLNKFLFWGFNRQKPIYVVTHEASWTYFFHARCLNLSQYIYDFSRFLFLLWQVLYSRPNLPAKYRMIPMN